MPSSTDINTLLWEVALESARKAAAPTRPSRLDCVFACESIQEALIFRRRFRPDGKLLRVQLLEAVSPCHRGDFSLISDSIASGPYTDYMSLAAARYWTTEPSNMVEVLVGGAVSVLSEVE
ncbi:hypothetical protein RirG_027000 [Rhizophagus irregularis DAOM 197198w]|uniref:Uncharacterized protein n=1 Tax=Rhizophagus irregularis (strain DAOM 197198w) TaxID=1432141 RepID=A0A015LBM3_RHIIW|nr:hypothetical protein RirG_027000 [Rhizophagus irregularis DAOM 197198w]